MIQYESETGKNAIWRGKQTKGFKEWQKEKAEAEYKRKTVICPWCKQRVKDYLNHKCPKK